MSLKDSVTSVGKAAGIAAATAGLSTCQNSCGTVVDPVPPPLICSDVAQGQSLRASAQTSGELVVATIQVTGSVSSWQINRVGDAVGATIANTALPTSTVESLVVSLRPATASTTQIDFTVEGVLTGIQSETCNVKRIFHVTVGTTGVQIAETNLDSLPLSARHGAQIAALGRTGKTLHLEARTTYGRPHRVSWEVTAGELDSTETHEVAWTLPDEPGIYQAEVLLDYGADGVAFDAFMLEVFDSPEHPVDATDSSR